jgi:hypothetical protein
LQIRRLGGVVSEVRELKAGRERTAMMTWREAVTRTKGKIGGQHKMGDEEKKEGEKRAGAEGVEWAEGDDDDL